MKRAWGSQEDSSPLILELKRPPCFFFGLSSAALTVLHLLQRGRDLVAEDRLAEESFRAICEQKKGGGLTPNPAQSLFPGLIKCREQVFAQNYSNRAAHGHSGGQKLSLALASQLPRAKRAARAPTRGGLPKKLLLPQLPSQQFPADIKGPANNEQLTLPPSLPGQGLPAPTRV